MKQLYGRAGNFLDALRSSIQGPVLVPGDEVYDKARTVWNGAVDNHPAAIAVCQSVQDVQAAILVALKYVVPLSILGGGYDWAGRSIRRDGLVIALSALDGVTIDAKAQTATIQGGTTATTVATAAAAYGLTAVTGTIGKIGMVGFTLGGGYGPLSPNFGLGVDNLIGAEVVLADGRHVVANSSENSDLFWALRGGGGNFGVVTSMLVRLHPIREVLAGKLVFPWSDARSVLRGYAQMMAFAPDELALTVALVSGPGGGPAIVLAPCWSGDMARGQDVIAKVQDLGTPVAVSTGKMPPEKLFELFEPSAPPGRSYTQQTRWLSDITVEAIGNLEEIGSVMTSSFSVVAVQSFHGAPSRVPICSTAFGLRRKHFLVSIVAGWNADPEVDGTIHGDWARNASTRLASCALPGGYPNLLGPGEQVQSNEAYGENTTRLLALKRCFDPEERFAATSLPLEACSRKDPITVPV